MKENTGATTQLNMVPQPPARDLQPETRLPTETLVKAGNSEPVVVPQLETRDARPETRDAQPPPTTPLRRGGQTGNQNARVHGFYSKKAPFYRQDLIDEASGLEGIDAEIGFLRSCLQYVSELDPPNPKLASDIVRTLSLAMVRRKYSGHTVLIDKARRIVGDDHPDAGTDAPAVEVAPAVEK